MVEPSASILSGHRAQDQVILPVRVAFRICLRGIRTRLGRSLVTLTGVALGIAFLMSVVANFHIRRAMKDDLAMKRDVDRWLTVLRSEAGRFNGKRALVIVGQAGPREVSFLRGLESKGTEVCVLTPGSVPEGFAAPTAGGGMPFDIRVSLAGADALLAGAALDALAGGRLLVMHGLSEDAAKRLAQAGIATKTLRVEQRLEERQRQERQDADEGLRMLWIVVVSLLITVGGITNSMLMSVTERFREIATMKCLGALSGFVLKLFLIESSLMGCAGSLIGVIIGGCFSLVAYSFTYSFARVFSAVDFVLLLAAGAGCVAIGILLSVIAGIYPARVAAKMVPAVALASHV